MKAADIKRILSTPTVRGELKIKDTVIPFACLYEDNKENTCCVMAGKHEKVYIDVIRGFKFWTYVSGIFLERKIRISSVTILWCTYDGLMSKTQFNQL